MRCKDKNPLETNLIEKYMDIPNNITYTGAK